LNETEGKIKVFEESLAPIVKAIVEEDIVKRMVKYD